MMISLAAARVDVGFFDEAYDLCFARRSKADVHGAKFIEDLHGAWFAAADGLDDELDVSVHDNLSSFLARRDCRAWLHSSAKLRTARIICKISTGTFTSI